jgi:hypothetical protein
MSSQFLPFVSFDQMETDSKEIKGLRNFFPVVSGRRDDKFNGRRVL